MWTFTITITLLLTVTSSHGGLVRRSISDKPKPYTSGKNLLTMGSAGEAIKKSFQGAGSELEKMAKDLENEVEEISDLAAYIDLKETERMSEALAEAKNIQSLMNDQRTELSGLAKNTISKCETIVNRFKDMAAGTRKLDSGMRSVLRNMRKLLEHSEEKLKEAKVTIKTLREKINKVLATLRVFKGLIKAAKERDEAVSQGLPTEDITNIVGGIVTDIKTGADGFRKAKKGDGTISVITSVVSGLTRAITGIMKAVNRPEVGPKLDGALSKVNGAITIVEKQKEAMEKEVELIIVWKDAVEIVKIGVFNSDLKEKKEEEEQELYEEIEEIIEDGDLEEITDPFESLKDAANGYLLHVKKVCRACTE